ncbi:MAG: dihydroorotate dehydrogenase electron transfer subunit [bacterium]
MVSQLEFAAGHHLIRLACPDYGGGFLPGQFVNLKCDDTPWGRLYRPFSVLGYDVKRHEIEIYYHAAGSGTRWLAARPEGTGLKILLPLGKGFTVPEGARKVALVAGGVGNAPLIFLARKLRETRPEVRVEFFMGARKKEALCIPLFEREKMAPKYSTDDGSFGHHGSVVDLLANCLENENLDYVACCGPTPMMAAVQRTAAGRVAGEASLEERMACGIGACFGCVATVVDEDGTEKRITTCRNGPVIPLDRVRFG